MTRASEPAPLLIAFTLLVFATAGCGGKGNASNAVIDAELVAGFRAEATQRAHAIDTGIAAMEAEGASADSAEAIAFRQAINELLESRHVLQQGLGSLDTLTAAQFEIVSDSLSAQLEALELRVDQAPFELASDLDGLRGIALRSLDALIVETEELRAGADSTLDAALVSLEQRANAFASTLRVANEDELRQSAATALRRLRSSLDSLRSVSARRERSDESTDAN